MNSPKRPTSYIRLQAPPDMLVLRTRRPICMLIPKPAQGLHHTRVVSNQLPPQFISCGSCSLCDVAAGQRGALVGMILSFNSFEALMTRVVVGALL